MKAKSPVNNQPNGEELHRHHADNRCRHCSYMPVCIHANTMINESPCIFPEETFNRFPPRELETMEYLPPLTPKAAVKEVVAHLKESLAKAASF